MKIERVDINSLHLDPSNARKHSDKNLAAIKGSLTKFGQQKPIVVDNKNVVIAGNGTLVAAKALGWDTIDIVKTELTKTEAIAFALADNKTSELAEWDMETLNKTLDALLNEGFEVEDIGFDIDDIPGLGGGGNTDEDSVPEVEQNIHEVKRGDIYLLGEHRLMCGDSTSKDDVDKLMGGEKADMVFTDPTYGIAYIGGSKVRKEIENDAIDVFPFYKAFLSIAKDNSRKGGSIYIWHASSETHNVINAALESGWLFKSYLVWVKNNSTFGRSDYHWQHEPAFYGWGADGSHEWHGDRKQTTTWMIDRPSVSKEHPTMKPVELCERSIINSSKSGYKIYDPFLGSGSTLIACEKTNRKCYGMEIDPHYCSVIIERWQQFTGKKAVKAGQTD